MKLFYVYIKIHPEISFVMSADDKTATVKTDAVDKTATEKTAVVEVTPPTVHKNTQSTGVDLVQIRSVLFKYWGDDDSAYEEMIELAENLYYSQLTTKEALEEIFEQYPDGKLPASDR